MSAHSVTPPPTSWLARGRERIRELIHYRYLLQNLIVRDLKVRYKNSILGVAWSMLNPLLMMLVFTLIFGVLSPDRGIRDYPVFFLVGLLPWNLFSGSLMGGTVAFGSNANLIKKVYFPRELLPLGIILSNLVNFLIALLVLVVFLYLSGLGLTLNALWVPVILLIQIVFTLGLSLLLGSLYVFFRDIVMILDVVMLAWFFLTPIIYPLEQLGSELTIAGVTFVPAVVMRWLNPMASIIDGYRTVLWGTMGSNGAAAMDPAFIIRTAATALVTFIVGYAVFARTQHLFGEKL
jgi:ABC-type polysaccharide/polyol phosphate export permease